ncbi:MAG TPA: hypothetical protein VD866_02455 [Urbifossiella sp.]|nr:hypothetical protein [Urbifossiella sp.]
MTRKTTATATKPTRTRKAKPTAEPAAQLSPREQELQTKYAHQSIIPGSWRHAGHPDRSGLGDKKATVEVKCKMEGCDQQRIVCTSDLQWRTTCYCPAHAKLIHANHRATKAEKKKLT